MLLMRPKKKVQTTMADVLFVCLFVVFNGGREYLEQQQILLTPSHYLVCKVFAEQKDFRTHDNTDWGRVLKNVTHSPFQPVGK